jgi:hypothetical protein
MNGAWRWSLVAVAAVGLGAAVLPMLILWSQLPEPIAVHWSADFRPDGSMPKHVALWPPAAIIGGALLISLIGAGHAYRHGRAARLMVVAFGSGLAAATSATIVTRNLGRAVWSDAGSQTPGLLVLQIGMALVSASRVWRDVRPPPAARGSALPLAPGARAFWSGGASNPWLLGIGAYLLVQALALQAWLPPFRMLPVWLALHIVMFVALEFFSRVRVTIDRRGVAIRYGHLGLWTRRVPLERITAAHAIALDALEHGGWGYRGGLLLFGKASIVVRSGPAIRLDLDNGQRLFVTVDDASTGARLLNALLDREPPRGSDAAEITSPG